MWTSSRLLCTISRAPLQHILFTIVNHQNGAGDENITPTEQENHSRKYNIYMYSTYKGPQYFHGDYTYQGIITILLYTLENTIVIHESYTSGYSFSPVTDM